jgi:acetyl/propionyl-CoA carboxylase alpha subunit
MIAKLIVHAETREKALQQSSMAIRKFWIKGPRTTLAFCRAVLQNSNFRKGNFNTSFLSKELKLHYHAEPEEEILAAFFATYDYAREVHQFEEKPLRLEKSQKISPWVLKKRLR